MTAPFDPLEAALGFAAALEEHGVEYAIGGALALSSWSEPRMTSDVDVDVNVFVEPTAPVLPRQGPRQSRAAGAGSAAARSRLHPAAHGRSTTCWDVVDPYPT